MQCYTCAQNVLVHPTMYIVTGWLAPCIVTASRLRLLIINGILSCAACILALMVLVPMADQVGYGLSEYPSFLHCLPRLSKSAGEGGGNEIQPPSFFPLHLTVNRSPTCQWVTPPFPRRWSRPSLPRASCPRTDPRSSTAASPCSESARSSRPACRQCDSAGAGEEAEEEEEEAQAQAQARG